MPIIYDNIKGNQRIRIFGEEFVKNNKDKCLLIIKRKLFDLKEFCENINK